MERDLSGDWTGQYTYPDDGSAAFFTARLFEKSGRFNGSIEEVDTFAGQLRASVDGRRSGSTVRFTKFYDLGSEEFDTVVYEGVLSEDGSEVEGRWTVPNSWSGRFLMVRASEQGAKLGRKHAVRV